MVRPLATDHIKPSGLNDACTQGSKTTSQGSKTTSDQTGEEDIQSRDRR